MPEPVTEILMYRHRGYKNSMNGVVVQVFGNDPAPTDPDPTINYTLLWDHDVVTTTTVKPHQDQPAA